VIATVGIRLSGDLRATAPATTIDTSIARRGPYNTCNLATDAFILNRDELFRPQQSELLYSF
jgi:hypothetical protein